MPTGSARQLEERAMHSRIRRHPALKHGAYSAIAVLPGESRAEFEKLHRDVIAELAPSGVLEDNIVMKIARFTWRDQNLPTLRISERARSHRDAIRGPIKIKIRLVSPCLGEPKPDPDEREEQIQDPKERRQDDRLLADLGDAYELIEVGDAATFDGLIKELEIHELSKLSPYS